MVLRRLGASYASPNDIGYGFLILVRSRIMMTSDFTEAWSELVIYMEYGERLKTQKDRLSPVFLSVLSLLRNKLFCLCSGYTSAFHRPCRLQ